MILTKISILKDNYVWILYTNNRSCIIIDPGNSEEVIKKIEENKWNPLAILLTHYHSDHTSGVMDILKKYPSILIYGPYETYKFGVKKILKDGDKIFLLKKVFYVFSTPGHTEGHISYYSPPYIFCGDVVFSGGCGRVNHLQYRDMYSSIIKISNLPNNTLLCCSHEYTLSNLIFSMNVLPNDIEINFYYNIVKMMRSMKKSTLPSLIIHEKKINLFLRTNDVMLKKAIGMNDKSGFKTFVKLRKMKDNF